jgi:hypothetical protein
MFTFTARVPHRSMAKIRRSSCTENVRVELIGTCADLYGYLRGVAAEWLDVTLEDLSEKISRGRLASQQERRPSRSRSVIFVLVGVGLCP